MIHYVLVVGGVDVLQIAIPQHVTATTFSEKHRRVIDPGEPIALAVTEIDFCFCRNAGVLCVDVTRTF